MVPGLLFTYGVVSVLLVVNALRAPKPPTHRLPPLWLPAMIASEAGGLWLLVMPAVAAVAVAAEALWHPVGKVGLALTGVAWMGQLILWRRSWKGARAVGSPVPHTGSVLRRVSSRPPELPASLDRHTLALGPHPHSPEPLRMDLYRPVEHDRPLPLIVYVHGGGWRGGNPRQAGQAVIQHLARNGWAVAAIEYPLSPEATFPEHLVGIDHALDWASSNPGITPEIVLMGGSAGAHLSAVAALTRPNVAGLIGLYGIYDMINRHGTRQNWPLIPRLVMKTTPQQDPEAYRRASPIDLVNGNVPPSLLIAGTQDSLVPPAETHHFADVLTTHGADVTVLDVPWAQHGFDTLAGPRTRAVARAVEYWLGDKVLGTVTKPDSKEGLA